MKRSFCKEMPSLSHRPNVFMDQGDCISDTLGSDNGVLSTVRDLGCPLAGHEGLP